MWCPAGFYEDQDESGLTTCNECGVDDTLGAVCRILWDDHPMASGTTLQRMVLKEDYWRSSPRTPKVYHCALDHACRGGGVANGTTNYCNPGYEGPFCGTCSRDWFM